MRGGTVREGLEQEIVRESISDLIFARNSEGRLTSTSYDYRVVREQYRKSSQQKVLDEKKGFTHFKKLNVGDKNIAIVEAAALISASPECGRSSRYQSSPGGELQHHKRKHSLPVVIIQIDCSSLHPIVGYRGDRPGKE